jgi:hypothetical protein
MIFDSRQYEFSDLALILGKRDVTGFRGISYTEKVESEPVYGKGRYPHSIQRGNYSVEGQVVLLQSELETLIDSSPTKTALDLNLDATVSYGGNIENAAGAIRNDRVVGIRFTEVPKQLNQSDKFMEVTLPFVALRVQHNV